MIHLSKLFANERRNKILELLNKQHRITVKELSEMMSVSEATLRTDLNIMEEEGHLIRTHGGAMLDTKFQMENTYSEREMKNRHEKKRIGAKALELIQDGQCILLDGSPSCLELALALKNRQGRLTVVTNGISAAIELKDNPNITVILLGGMLRLGSVSVEGMLGANILKQIHVDTMFASASGFTIEDGLTDFNVYEVELKKFMVNSSSRLVALLDHTKIGKSSIASFAETNQIHTFITDHNTPEKFIQELREKNIEVLTL